VKTDQLGDAPRAKNFQEDRQMMRSVLMKLRGVFEAELLVYYQHRKFVSSAYEKNGTFCVPGRHKPGRGTPGPKYGMSREIRDCWQPYLSVFAATLQYVVHQAP